MNASNRLLRAALLGTALTALSAAASFAGTGSVAYNVGYLSQFGSSGSGNGQFNGPEEISQAANGNIYIADRYNSRVQVFDRDGNYLSTIGSNGFGDGQFGQVVGVDINPATGRLYTADSSFKRITIFNAAGVYQSKYGGTSGSGNGQFADPISIAHDSTGRIYIADDGNARVQVFDASGNYLTQFGTPGSGNGQFSNVSYIAIGPDDTIYVSDPGNGRVQVFDSSYNYVRSISVVSPSGVYVDSAGNLYVNSVSNYRMEVYDKNGNPVTMFGGTFGSGNGEFIAMRDVHVGSDGKIYISEFNNNRVQILQMSATETFTGSPVGGDETAPAPSTKLILNNSGTFADDFIGYDTLEVNGTSWTLSGSSSFTGDVDIVAGLLVNDGTMSAPNMTIASGAILGGTGTFVGDLANNGTIKPGAANAIGTTTVTGNYVHDASAVYEVNTNDAGQSDHIQISGTATINGGTVDVQAANGNYAANTDYNILTATGGRTGTFSNVTSNFAFLTPTLNYTANGVTLSLANPPSTPVFSGFAKNDSQAHTAASLDAFISGGLGGDAATLAALNGLSQAEATEILNQIAPDEIAVAPAMQMNATQQMQNPVFGRMETINPVTPQSTSSSSMSTSDVDTYALIKPSAGGINPRQIWVQAFGGLSDQDNQAQISGYKSHITGMRAGIDRQISHDTLVGVSAAYSRSQADYNTSRDNSEMLYGHLDVYGSHQQGHLLFEGMIGVGGGKLESTRYVDVGGLDLQANGETEAFDVSGSIRGSYLVELAPDLDLIPNVGVGAGWYRQNGFTETGSSPFNLNIDGNNAVPVTVNPMINLRKQWTSTEYAYRVTPNIGVGATWQVNERSQNVSSRFAQSGPGVPDFSVDGIEQEPLSLNLQASVTVEPFKGRYVPDVKVSAGTQINDEATNSMGSVTLNWRW